MKIDQKDINELAHACMQHFMKNQSLRRALDRSIDRVSKDGLGEWELNNRRTVDQETESNDIQSVTLKKSNNFQEATPRA